MAGTCSLAQVSQRAVMDNNNCHLIVIMTNVCQQNQQQQQVSVIFIQSSCTALLAVTWAAGFDNRILELGFPQLTILDFHNWQFWISTIADSQSTIVPRVSSCSWTSLYATGSAALLTSWPSSSTSCPMPNQCENRPTHWHIFIGKRLNSCGSLTIVSLALYFENMPFL